MMMTKAVGWSVTAEFFAVQVSTCSVHAVCLPGVELPHDEPAGQVVAAMQPFVAVCGSLAEVQAVAATDYYYICKWRFKLHSSKSAVMHVTR
jgi:hypothetical protein